MSSDDWAGQTGSSSNGQYVTVVNKNTLDVTAGADDKVMEYTLKEGSAVTTRMILNQEITFDEFLATDRYAIVEFDIAVGGTSELATPYDIQFAHGTGSAIARFKVYDSKLLRYHSSILGYCTAFINIQI